MDINSFRLMKLYLACELFECIINSLCTKFLCDNEAFVKE